MLATTIPETADDVPTLGITGSFETSPKDSTTWPCLPTLDSTPNQQQARKR